MRKSLHTISAVAALTILVTLCIPVQKVSGQTCFPITCGTFTTASTAPCSGTPTMNLGVIPPNFSCVTPDISRVGNCCNTTSPDRCLHFIFTIGPNVAAVRLEFVCGAIPNGSLFGQLSPDPVGSYPFNGCGQQFNIKDSLGCITAPGTWHLTFCKPGNNTNQYRITTVGRPTPMVDDSVRVGCFDTLSYFGVHVTGSSWNSIFPGVPGQYNSFLSSPFPHAPDSSTSVRVTPTGTPPAFVDYRVCGQAIAKECLGAVTFCDTIRVYFFSALTANISPDPARFCLAQGGLTLTGSATGGLPPYTYTWRNAANVVVDNDSSFFTNTPGTFRLFVGDQLFNPAACNTTVDTIVVTLDSISTSETHVNASCNGVCDGSIDLTVSSAGGGPFSYVWSDIGPGPQDRSSLCDGTYTVTVTTGGGACVATRTIVITEPATFVVVIDSVKNAGCNGEATGAIYTHTVGGTGTVTYLWSNGFTTQDIVNVVSNMYCVTATDAHGCVDTACAFIDQPAVLVPLITSVDINGNNVSCFGSTDDTSCASVSGGTPPYSYLWSPSLSTTQCVTGQGALLVCVTVTDANGCTGDTCKNITQPDLLELSIDDMSSFICGYQVSCNGNTDGFIDVTTHGGTFPFCYDWSNIPGSCPVDEGEDQSSLGAGTYTVTVTDANGCTSSISATLTEPPVVYDSIVSPLTPGGYNIRCRGECNAKIYSNVTGGCPPYTYTWTPNVSNVDSAVNLCAGFYMLTVTDVNGCSFTDTLTVTEPDTVLALITVVILNAGNPVSCFGVCDGKAYVTASGGSQPYTYSWTYPPLSVPTFSPAGDTIYSVCAGPISVIVSDTNGCSASDNNAITEPPLLTANVTVNTFNGGWNVSCNGVCDGSAFVTPAGGTPPYTYLWCNGDTSQTSSATLCAGPCAVTVTDDNGCDTTITFNLTEPPLLTVSITPLVRNCGFNISCNGACDGEVTANPVGGTTPYSYNWSSSCTSQTCTGLCATTYTVTVTDDNGCTATASVTLTEPTPLIIPPLTADTCLGGWNVCCNADTTGNVRSFPSGGCVPYSYMWSNGDTDSVANNVSVFIYYLTVTDNNGCIAHSDSIILTEPPPVTDVINVSLFDTVNISCNGACDGTATAVPSGGTAPYQYSWNTVPPQTTQTATGLCAGTYTVLITDTNGCTGIDSVTLIEPAPLSVSLTSTVASCNLGCTDTLVAFPSGGIGPYTYCWTPPGPPCPNGSDTLFNACIATYTVTVTDVNGCTATASIAPAGSAVVINVVITDSDFNGQDQPCNGNCLDTLTATPTTGSAPYTYVWSSGCPTQTCPNVCAGTYTVTVTDANGCSGTASFTVTEPPVLTASISGLNFNGWGEPCNGDCLDTLTANPVGGTAPYTYQWSTVCNTQSCPNLCAGTYTVTVTDVNGCTATASFTITEPPVLTVNITGLTFNTWGEPCNGDCANTLTANPAGGTPTYNYLWSNAASTQTIINVCAGIYTVTVTDANGCTATASYTVTEPPVLTVTITDLDFNGWDEPCNGSCQDSLFANPTGGTPLYSYLWSSGAPTQAIGNVCAGTYTVTVTDANGCTATASFTVTEPPLMTVNITDLDFNGWDEPCKGSCVDTLTANASGGTAPLSYQWSSGGPATPTDPNVCAGTYTVTVTDANGCSVSASYTATEPPSLLDSINVSLLNPPYNTTCPHSCDAWMQVYAFGGTPNYTYLWSTLPAQTTAFTDSTICDTTAFGSGTLYFITVTDANGCVITDSVTITDPYQPIAVIQTPSQDICDTVITLVADTPLPIYQGWWTQISGTGVFSPDTTSPIVTVSGLSYGDNVFIWWVGDSTCLAFDSITIRAFAPVNAEAGVYSDICEEDEPIRLHADSTYVGIGMWSKYPPTSSIIFDNVYDPNTFASNLDFHNIVIWTVTNGPCTDYDTAHITKLIPELCDSNCLEMPTAFSPNGDLFNDVFVIHCIEYSFNRDNNIKIFNRWGNLVYEKDNYLNNWYGQNNTGDENAGKPLPDGTYFVILSINKSTRYPEGRVLHGYVDLRR